MEIAKMMREGAQFVADFPLIDPGSSADLVRGAVLLAGTTTNTQGLIRGTGALVDVVGVLDEEAKSAAFGTVAAGTLPYRKVICEPNAIWRGEFSQAAANTIANDVASATATAATFTTAQTDDFDGGFLYAVSGTGSLQLRYIGAATTTVMTVGTGMSWTTTLDTTTDVAMLSGPNKALLDVITNASEFKSINGNGGAYVGRVHILSIHMKSDAHSYQRMTPTDHGNLNGLSNPRFFAEFFFTDTLLHKID